MAAVAESDGVDALSRDWGGPRLISCLLLLKDSWHLGWEKLWGFFSGSYKQKVQERIKHFSLSKGVCVLSCFSCVWLFVTMWTVALQAPLSVGFSRQEYWSGLSSPPPGHLPNPGIEPRSPALQVDSLPSEPPGKAPWMLNPGANWIFWTGHTSIHPAH